MGRPPTCVRASAVVCLARRSGAEPLLCTCRHAPARKTRLRVLLAAEPLRALAPQADMGGMGFIQSNHSRILFNSTMISFNVAEAARKAGVKRFWFASSACIYPEYKQLSENLDGAASVRRRAHSARSQPARGMHGRALRASCSASANALWLCGLSKELAPSGQFARFQHGGCGGKI